VPCRGIKEVRDDIGFVSSMDYDLGYFDLDTRVLESLDNPFGPRLLPMSPVSSVAHVFGPDRG
jgi:putative transposase